MTYSLDGIISNAVVRSGGAGRSGLHMILQIGMYSYIRMFLAPSYADTVTCLYDMAVGPKRKKLVWSEKINKAYEEALLLPDY